MATVPKRASPRARELRRLQTDAERKLWNALRNRQQGGHKFRRQVPVGPYIADFLCVEARVIVELDGSQHAEREDYDRARTAYLERQGFEVLRFWNTDALTNTSGVIETILAALDSPRPLAGEGDSPAGERGEGKL